MPRKCPHTGVMVATQAEFWQSEAESEGKGRSGGELQAEFFDDMEKTRQEEEKAYYNLSQALEEIQGAFRNADAEDGIEVPTSITKVIHVEWNFSFREKSLAIFAEAVKPNGEKGLILYTDWGTNGSFDEPPDGESNIEWFPIQKYVLTGGVVQPSFNQRTHTVTSFKTEGRLNGRPYTVLSANAKQHTLCSEGFSKAEKKVIIAECSKKIREEIGKLTTKYGWKVR